MRRPFFKLVVACLLFSHATLGWAWSFCPQVKMLNWWNSGALVDMWFSYAYTNPAYDTFGPPNGQPPNDKKNVAALEMLDVINSSEDDFYFGGYIGDVLDEIKSLGYKWANWYAHVWPLKYSQKCKTLSGAALLNCQNKEFYAIGDCPLTLLEKEYGCGCPSHMNQQLCWGKPSCTIGNNCNQNSELKSCACPKGQVLLGCGGDIKVGGVLYCGPPGIQCSVLDSPQCKYFMVGYETHASGPFLTNSNSCEWHQQENSMDLDPQIPLKSNALAGAQVVFYKNYILWDWDSWKGGGNTADAITVSFREGDEGWSDDWPLTDMVVANGGTTITSSGYATDLPPMFSTVVS